MSDQVLLSIAAVLASKAVVGLSELVRARFSDDLEAVAVLQAAENAPDDAPAITALADSLETAQQRDPEFGDRLRDVWNGSAAVSQTAGVTNQITGAVSGKALQAGDIHGSVTF